MVNVVLNMKLKIEFLEVLLPSKSLFASGRTNFVFIRGSVAMVSTLDLTLPYLTFGADRC